MIEVYGFELDSPEGYLTAEEALVYFQEWHRKKRRMNEMVRLFVKDNTNGCIHEYGEDCHDALVLQEDGSLHYENLQNGCGTMFPAEGYSFCTKDGVIPPMNDMYIDVGGEQITEPIRAHWIINGDWGECSNCHEASKLSVMEHKDFCPACGARMVKG